MSATPEVRQRYALSFTSGGLLAREALVAAPLYVELRDWRLVRHQLRAQNLLQARTASSGIRLVREIAQRLEVLTDSELEWLVEAAPGERAHLMWVAACRRYEFIGDFAEEVVRERFLLLTPKLGYSDFDSFVQKKTLWHPELVEVKNSTLQKIRATVFRMLAEAGLLVRGEIIHASLSDRILELLDAKQSRDALFFPIYARREPLFDSV